MSERFANSVNFGETRGDARPSDSGPPPSILSEIDPEGRSSRRTLAPGARIGPYVLEAKIGAGGFGEVWRAFRVARAALGDEAFPGDGWGAFEADSTLPVALKVALGLEAREALRRQGAAQRRVEHYAIVRVLDEDLACEPPYVVFEHVDGENLRAHLARLSAERVDDPPEERLKLRRTWTAQGWIPLPSEEGRARPLTLAERSERLAPIFRAVAHALAHAHERGIVHGDLKPENVLLSSEGRALLTDFGLGTTAAGAEVALSRSLASTTLGGGTLAYLAPERHMGAPPTSAGDVWSLGIMLFEACHGRLPQGFERHPGWPLEPLFAACYAPEGSRLRSGIELRFAAHQATAPRPRQHRVEPIARSAPAPHAGRTVRASPRRLSLFEGLGAMALVLALGSVLSYLVTEGEHEGRRQIARVLRSRQAVVQAPVAPLAGTEIYGVMRDARAVLARMNGRGPTRDDPWVLGEMGRIQGRGESIGYRVIPDVRSGSVAAYPRVEGWPAYALHRLSEETHAVAREAQDVSRDVARAAAPEVR